MSLSERSKRRGQVVELLPSFATAQRRHDWLSSRSRYSFDLLLHANPPPPPLALALLAQGRQSARFNSSCALQRMSGQDAQSVHKSTSRAQQSTSTTSISHHNHIDLTEDQDPPQSPPALKTFRPRLPPPQQPAAPTPTAAGSVFLKTSVKVEYRSTSSKKASRAWDDPAPQSSSSSNMAPQGQSFAPADPELKKGRGFISSPFGPYSTGDMGRPSTSSVRGRGKAATGGQRRVFNDAITRTGNGGKKASTPKASAMASAQPSSLSSLGPIPKTGQRQDNPRSQLLPESRRNPHTDLRSPPPEAAPSFNIKGGASRMPRAAQTAAEKGKGKAEDDSVMELSSDDDVLPNGDGDDPIEDFDDAPSASEQRKRRRSAVDQVKGAAGAGDSSPDPLGFGEGPFNLTREKAGRGRSPPNSRSNVGGYVQNEIAHIEGKLASAKPKAPKLSDRMQGKRSSAAASTEKEKNRRADGRGESENEYDPATKPAKASSSSTKPRTSAASSSSTLLDLPIELYSFADRAPQRHLRSDYRLVYNYNGSVSNHKISIHRTSSGKPVLNFQRDSCNALDMSKKFDEPPLLRFDFNDQFQGLGQVLEECGTNERSLRDNDLRFELVIVFKSDSLGELQRDSHMRTALELFKRWAEEPRKIIVIQLETQAELTMRHKWREALARGPEQNPPAQASSSRQVAVSPGTNKRVPKKAQLSAKDGMQQTTLDNTAVRRSSRASTSIYAAPQPRPPSAEIDHVPSEKLVLVYPVRETTGVVSITHGDTKRLQDGEFLNDTLIEFGLKRILFKLRQKEEKAGLVDDTKRLSSTVHMFNSFFYKKISYKGKKTSANGDKFEAYAAVKKWTNKFNLFEKQFVVVPINEHLHWYLAVIVNPGAALHLVADLEVKAPPVTRTSARNKARQSSEAQQPDPAAPLPDITGPINTSKFFASAHASTNGREAVAMEVEQAREDQEEQEEREQEESLAERINAAAAATQCGIEDSDSGGDVMVEDVAGRLEDVTMTDAGSTRPNSPAAGRRAPSLVEAGDVSSSDDDGDAISRNLGARDAPTSAQAPPAARPPSPHKPLSRTATPILPSKIAPGDTAAPPQAQQSMTIEDEPSQPPPATKHQTDRCYIYVFDSLDGNHPAAFRNLARYLVAEAKDKLDISLSYDLIMSMAAPKNVRVPLQDNFSDCGLYILHYVEQLLNNPQEMLDHMASVPEKVPRDQAAAVKELVNEKWDGPAAAGKRKVLREEINELSQQWAAWREPLEEEEQRKKEDRRREKQEAKAQEDEARTAAEAAQAVELAEQRELEATLQASRSMHNAEADEDSSMVVEEPEQQRVAPSPMEEQEPSPAPSTTSTRGKKSKKARAPRKKKEVEVLTLLSDDDSDEDADAPPPQRTSNGAATATSAHFQLPIAASSNRQRGAESSTFIPNLPMPKGVPPTVDSRANAGPSAFDVDPAGDLETPEPDSQHRPAAAGPSRRQRSSPPLDAMGTQGNDSPPKKKKRPNQSPAPNYFAVPSGTPDQFADAEQVIAAAAVIARDTVSKRTSGSHIRFDGSGQRLSPSGDILVASGAQPTSSADDIIIIPGSLNSRPRRPAPQISPELGVPSPAQPPPPSPSRARPPNGFQNFAVVVPVHTPSSSQHRQQGSNVVQNPPAASSPVQVMDAGRPAIRREKKERSAKGAQDDMLVID